MTMIFNGAELEEVRFNGVDCQKVYFNGALIFEKINQYLLTVGQYPEGEGVIHIGYKKNGSDGDLNPKFIIELGQELEYLYWYDEREAGHEEDYGIVILGESQAFDYSGLWLLTIGDWEGVLVGGDAGYLAWTTYLYPPGGRPFTNGDFMSLPKSGTRSVTLSRVS